LGWDVGMGCWDWIMNCMKLVAGLSRFNASWLALGNDVYIRVLG
jgi:hypothetical protein